MKERKGEKLKVEAGESESKMNRWYVMACVGGRWEMKERKGEKVVCRGR